LTVLFRALFYDNILWQSKSGSKFPIDELKKLFLKEEKENGSNKRKTIIGEWGKYRTVV
jgi:hypothetical protein